MRRPVSVGYRFAPAPGVQTPSDLVPALDVASLAALRAGFAGITRDPDFAALAAHQPDAKALSSAVGRVIDALDEVRFAMASVGMPTESAVAAN